VILDRLDPLHHSAGLGWDLTSGASKFKLLAVIGRAVDGNFHVLHFH